MRLMERAAKAKRLLWVSRGVSILFILFLSLFAFDTFSGDVPAWQKSVGFLIHLIPSFVLLAVLIVSWKHPAAGGIAFIVMSIVFTFYFNTYRQPASFLAVSAPPFVIGALFIASSVMGAKKSA